MKIKHRIKTHIDAFFSKDKEKFWFEYYKHIYINYNISMFDVLLDAKFNSVCPENVIFKLSSWFDEYSRKKWNFRRDRLSSTILQFYKTIREVNIF